MPSSALLPWVGLPGPHPGLLSFYDERNQRRARGAAPGPRWGAIIIPPAARAPLPPEKVQLRAARNQQTTCRATD